MPAVLFDLGNVLVRLCFERGLARLRGLAPRAAAVTHLELLALPPVESVARGTLAAESFIAALARALGTDAPPAELAAAWCDVFDPLPEMEALAEAVVATGHPTYLASNTDPLHFALLRRRLPVLERMRGLYLSYEAGALKPEGSFFTGLLSRFALEPGACVFIDDRPENIAAARAVGIRGHVFDGDVDAARRCLRSAGIDL